MKKMNLILSLALSCLQMTAVLNSSTAHAQTEARSKEHQAALDKRLFDSIAKRKFDEAIKVLELGANANAREKFDLYGSIYEMESVAYETVKTIIDLKYDIAYSSYGESYVELQKKNLEKAEAFLDDLILKYGANMSAKFRSHTFDMYNEVAIADTLLILGDKDMIRYFEDKFGIKVSPYDFYSATTGDSLLHLVGHAGDAHADGVTLLVAKYKQMVDSLNLEQQTPLMAAASKCAMSVATSLLLSGANPKLKDKSEKTAADHARDSAAQYEALAKEVAVSSSSQADYMKRSEFCTFVAQFIGQF